MTLNRRDFLKTGTAASLALWLDTILGPLKLAAAEIDQSVPEMIYRRFGKTQLELSVLGMGGSRYPYNEGNPEKAIALITKAYEYGINYFETGPEYVQDKSEEYLGLALKEIDKNNQKAQNPLPYYWGTKSGLYLGDHTADDVRRRIDVSLKRIGKDCVPLYHMWAIMNLDHYKEVMKKGGPYEGAMKAKKEGLIDHIIFSTHASGEENIQIINDEVFEGILVGYNITNFPRQEKAIRQAAEKNMGVLVMNPLAGGLIPRNEDYFKERLQNSNTKMSLVQTALAFVMGQPEITVALSGMEKEEYIVENIKTINYLKILKPEQLTGLKEKYLEGLKGICTTCQYCTNICPEKVAIDALMRAYNSFILQGKERFHAWARWYKGAEEIDFQTELAKCIRCGKCEQVCTQHLNILERFDQISRELL
ncbi:MAG: aldo/keto reductase [Candidatus Marinimicrobia bacterium]|nr:aldo/keto reductase [Candidatus Neomarinimicrobiota bacterium]